MKSFELVGVNLFLRVFSFGEEATEVRVHTPKELNMKAILF